MNRFSLAISIFGLAFSSHFTAAQTSFPVDHREPIVIHIVDSRDGHPIAHLHLALVAGYDSSDLKKNLWVEDAMTDEHGNVRLPSTIMNLPWLEVRMPKSSVCRADPRADIFSVERVRRDGLSAPNRCGTVTMSEMPGVLNVFVLERNGEHTARD